MNKKTKAGSNGVYWAGYYNGKPSFCLFSIFGSIYKPEEYPSLFVSRRIAKTYYDDVRKVRIIEITK